MDGKGFLNHVPKALAGHSRAALETKMGPARDFVTHNVRDSVTPHEKPEIDAAQVGKQPLRVVLLLKRRSSGPPDAGGENIVASPAADLEDPAISAQWPSIAVINATAQSVLRFYTDDRVTIAV